MGEAEPWASGRRRAGRFRSAFVRQRALVGLSDSGRRWLGMVRWVLITPRASILRLRGSLSPAQENRRERTVPPRPAREAAWVALAGFLALVLLRGTALADPPYWDALIGLFPQAHWQAANGLDPFRLLREQPGYVQGGASVYPFSAIPPLLALLERALPDASARFALLHLASFACAGLAAGAVYRLARPCGRGAAVLAAAVFLAQPGVQALASQIGLEMPLVACAACALAALAEGRFAASFGWAAAALLVKPTGVVVAVAALAYLLARALFPRVAGPRAGGELGWAAAHAFLGATFAAQLAILAAFERAPPGTGILAGLVPLATKRLWAVPEFGVALALLAIGAGVAWARRARSTPIPAAVLVPALFLAVYLGVLAQWQNTLPRYFVAAYPAAIALVVAALARCVPARLVGPALGALALYGLLGAHGGLQPERPAAYAAPGETAPLAANDGWLLERSLRFRDGLELDRQVARYASERTDAVFVAPWPLHQALLEPALGYVTRRVECATAETPVAWTREPPPRLADLRAGDREILWILTPNVFAGRASVPLPGDVVVQRFAVGDQRAFVVRRPNFP